MTPSPHWIDLWLPMLYRSLWVWGALEVWIMIRDWRQVRGERADRGSLWVLVVLLNAGIWCAIGAAYRLPEAAIAAPQPGLMISGVILIWAGMALRLWSVLTLGSLFRITVIVQEDHELVTRGPYSLLRHPSYAGVLVILLGLGLGCGNWVSLAAVTAAALAGFGWRVRAEEQALRSRFGPDYAAYAARTWAVVPFIW